MRKKGSAVLMVAITAVVIIVNGIEAVRVLPPSETPLSQAGFFDPPYPWLFYRGPMEAHFDGDRFIGCWGPGWDCWIISDEDWIIHASLYGDRLGVPPAGDSINSVTVDQNQNARRR